MNPNSLTELTTIESLLAAADVPEDHRQSALWCLRQLPPLFHEFLRTYDSRQSDEILRLARALLLKLNGAAAGAVREQLVGLYERLGLGEFPVKAAPPAPARRTRKAC
ncbi:MAG: hypothetical protein IT429_00735 [Gemmataceae bacterium]|nr:hypothetical protein [Gemmataceae bacterium]